jgi:predicted metal-dependent hydrolase
MGSVEYIILAIGIIYMMFYVREQFSEVELIKSKKDGRSYLVKNLPDAQRAADLLADINEKLQQLINHMVKMDPHDSDVERLKHNYNPDALSEGTDESEYTSYSINKQAIVFCLRSRDGKYRLVKENTLMYVAVHELAHMMTKEIGHTEGFWKNFKRLLKEAVNIGLYKKVDYSKYPVEYCGIQVTSTVLE